MSPGWSVALAVLAGTLVRFFTLRIDYRQYPSYPQGYVIHLSLATVASFLGALAVPALVAREFAAASFLALAATQFREVRKIEREALANLEETELVRRGAAYIEGIARVFEARNYVSMVAAFTVSAALTAIRPAPLSALSSVGLALLVFLTVGRASRGPRVRDIASVQEVSLRFDGPLLTVQDAVLINVGRSEARRTWERQGMAFLILPRDRAAAATLASPGQRQAILHDVVARVGVRMDVDEPEFAPFARRHVKKDAVVVVLIPQIADRHAILDAIGDVPVLESGVRLTGYWRQAGVPPHTLEAGRSHG